MDTVSEPKANSVKSIIERDFNALDTSDLEEFLEKFMRDRRTISFIEYYNRTVLDKQRIDFGEFKHQWAIQGMPSTCLQKCV